MSGLDFDCSTAGGGSTVGRQRGANHQDRQAERVGTAQVLCMSQLQGQEAGWGSHMKGNLYASRASAHLAEPVKLER